MTIELYQSPQKITNEEKYGLITNQCICCGKPMKASETKLVHMNTWGEVMHNSIVDEKDAEFYGYESQGYFPIGNSCAKKMNKNFIHS